MSVPTQRFCRFLDLRGSACISTESIMGKKRVAVEGETSSARTTDKKIRASAFVPVCDGCKIPQPGSAVSVSETIAPVVGTFTTEAVSAIGVQPEHETLPANVSNVAKITSPAKVSKPHRIHHSTFDGLYRCAACSTECSFDQLVLVAGRPTHHGKSRCKTCAFPLCESCGHQRNEKKEKPLTMVEIGMYKKKYNGKWYLSTRPSYQRKDNRPSYRTNNSPRRSDRETCFLTHNVLSNIVLLSLNTV